MPEFNWDQYEDVPETFDWDKYQDAETSESPTQSKGFSGILEDLGTSARNIPDEALQLFSDALKESYKSGKQLISEPFKSPPRIARNVLSGLGEGAKGAFNLPLNIATYLGSKDIPYFKQISPLAEKLKIGETGLEKAILGEEQEGDALWKALASFYPYTKIGAGIPGKKGLALKAAGGAAFGGGNESNPLFAALLNVLPEIGINKANEGISNVKNLNDIYEGANNAEATFLQSKDQLAALQEALGNEFAETTPGAFSRSINKKQEQLEKLAPDVQIPFEQTENLLLPPSLEELIPNSQREITSLESEISNYLNRGSNHDVIVQEGILNAVKNRKREIQDTYYHPFEENIQNEHIAIPRDIDTKEFEHSLIKFMGGGFELTEGFKKAVDKFKKDNHAVDLIPAIDFWNMYKETRDAASDAFSKSRKEGGDRKAHYEKESQELRDLAEKQLEILQSHVGDENLNLLNQGNYFWSKDITPLYGNPLYEQAKKRRGLNSGNIIKATRGEHRGQEILRNIITENPDLNRAAVGQLFAENPRNLLDLNMQQSHFVNQLPQLEGMMGRLRNALATLDRNQDRVSQRADEIKRINKGFEESLKKQMTREKAIKESERLKREIKQLEKARAELIEEQRKVDIDEEEYKEMSRQRDEIDRSINKLKDALGKAIKIGATAIGIGKPKNILKKLIR